MSPEEIVKQLSVYNPEQLETFSKRVMEQKYSSNIVRRFVNSRLMNYWIEENRLLSKWEEKGWRKFSFVDLVWLKIISNLREFGVSFAILKKLKEELFYIPTPEKLIKVLNEKKDDISKLITKLHSKEDKQLASFLLKIEEIKDDIKGHQIPLLLIYIQSVIFFKSSGSLLINVEGEHVFLSEKHLGLILQNEENRFFFRQSHVSISLTDIIEFYILKEEVDIELTKEIFSEDEFKIMETIRKENPSSLFVKFDDNRKVNLIKVKKTKRAELAHRLSDIILKDGYEEITLKTQKGKIVTCTSVKTIK